SSAEAHLGLALGGEPLFERPVSMPRTGAFRTETIVVDRDAPAGTPLVLHLHNHGSNLWTIEQLVLLPPAP
ncbi:MAG: hypothetical protein AAFU79_30085, partial [Myxococcota bacterium]